MRIINNILNTLLADEISYNLKMFMKAKGLNFALAKRSKGETAGRYVYNAGDCLTEQFDKVEQLVMNNNTVEAKFILDLYRFIKFYNKNDNREINDYPIEATKDLMDSVTYFLVKYNLTYTVD